MNKFDATIMAVKSSALPASILETGFNQFHFQEVVDILEEAGVWWGKRGELEKDESFKQIIPYVIIRQGDKYASYTRGVSGSEDRLHGKVSIGIGGHIDLTDCIPVSRKGYSETDADLTLQVALNRELFEEVMISNETLGDLSQTSLTFGACGIVYEDETDVGRVHLGVVMEISIQDNASVQSNEPDLVSVEFKTREELLALGDRLELWTKLYLESQS